jgi:2-oxoacid:acceptor oxidoreductase delta subunit (pyruvate/2-ketoisovalerate family)
MEPGVATGKRVLVIGAGPSGLAAAYHLARLGHAVTIYEAGPKPGGMMRFGIPQYRLPRNILDAEIARIVALGVSIHLNQKVENLETAIKEGGFDAVFLAIGAHLSKRVDIPGRDAGRMIDALGFLKGMDGEAVPKIGRRVVVYGGGNTAIDAARTAKRLGAEETILIYRRDREHMPAHDFEVEEALEEGVLTRWLNMIRQVDDTTVTVEEMSLDAQGRPQPTGRFETLEADTLILAIGQEVDTGFLAHVSGLDISSDGVIQVDGSMMTGRAGVFAGGDMVPAERTVTVATGHGRKAARHIDAYLRGGDYKTTPPNSVATYDRLNTWYYTDADQSRQPYLDLVRRRASFEEVVGGLDQDTALLEARRCLSCGNCFECDTCYGVCPDNAIIKLGPGQRYEVNYDYCKGCGVCAEECPCGAIDMVKEVR